MATIESQDLSISKLFDDFYVVPSYQREYVWENQQVEDFFEDIYGEFDDPEIKEVPEYFIGSIIVCLRNDGLYEVIDGQQRITTSYLLLCAIRSYLQEFSANEGIALLDNQISSTDIDDQGNNQFRYRVELQYADSRGVLEKIAQQQELTDVPKTTSTENIKKAYFRNLDLLRKNFSKNCDTNLARLKRFYAHFTRNVILVRVKTATVADALRVFATINYRGVNLDAIDLVKNLMFMEATPEEYESIKKTWKRMIDLLYSKKEDPIRFIRYFLIADYANESVKEREIYSWLLRSKNRKIYQNDSVRFVQELWKASKFYTQILPDKNKHQNHNRYLSNLHYLSPNARMPLMMLLAGRHLPTPCFHELCRHIENIFFVYLITREPTRNFNKIFPRWCQQIRKLKNQKQVSEFIENEITSQKKKLRERFELAFLSMDESTPPKTQLKYILAKLTQYIDETAYGSEGAEADLKTYINKQVTIEHILPEDPKQESVDAFDKKELIDEYIKRLGNLTLLESSLNSAIKNETFQKKKEAYPKSKFLLTKTISANLKFGKNTAIDRAVQKLTSFENWDSEAIDKRQEILTELAKEVWEIPSK